MNRATRRTVDRIRNQFEEFHSLADRAEIRVERISGWSVGQHFDHLMKADRNILRGFEEPMDGPMPPLSTAGRFILWSGWIPRGKGKAPKGALPEAPGPEQLGLDIQAVRSIFESSIEPEERLADPKPVFRHHLFGGMSAAEWLRFIAVHHHHHAKIVREIVRADPA